MVRLQGRFWRSYTKTRLRPCDFKPLIKIKQNSQTFMARLLNSENCNFRWTCGHLVNRLEFISYTEMLSLWKKGSRNGAIRRLPSLQRGLFSAALEYTRSLGNIINQQLVGMVRGVAEKFGKSLGKKIFDHGIERASAMFKNAKMKAFPNLRRWIDCDSYIFWLGTDLFLRQRSWIYFSYSIPPSSCKL
jgi:hypothetical protein